MPGRACQMYQEERGLWGNVDRITAQYNTHHPCDHLMVASWTSSPQPNEKSRHPSQSFWEHQLGSRGEGTITMPSTVALNASFLALLLQCLIVAMLEGRLPAEKPVLLSWLKVPLNVIALVKPRGGLFLTLSAGSPAGNLFPWST